MDPTTRPADDRPATELEQRGDRAPDDAVDQQRDRGADEAATAGTGEG